MEKLTAIEGLGIVSNSSLTNISGLKNITDTLIVTKELEKIEKLERKYEKKRRELEEIRSRTTECPVPDLTNPRDCYFGSRYKCTWNERAARCDKKMWLIITN